MNQEKINVSLTSDGDNDLLTFDIKDKPNDEAYIVNLSDAAASQIQLKRVFARLLTILMDKDIILELKIEVGFSKALQKEVSEEYISALNKELVKVKEELDSEFSKIEHSSTPESYVLDEIDLDEL